MSNYPYHQRRLYTRLFQRLRWKKTLQRKRLLIDKVLSPVVH